MSVSLISTAMQRSPSKIGTTFCRTARSSWVMAFRSRTGAFNRKARNTAGSRSGRTGWPTTSRS